MNKYIVVNNLSMSYQIISLWLRISLITLLLISCTWSYDVMFHSFWIHSTLLVPFLLLYFLTLHHDLVYILVLCICSLLSPGSSAIWENCIPTTTSLIPWLGCFCPDVDTDMEGERHDDRSEHRRLTLRLKKATYQPLAVVHTYEYESLYKAVTFELYIGS